MLPAFTRHLPVAVLTVALLTGCGNDPDTAVSLPTAGQPSNQQTASVVGLLTSADADKVVIGLPDGSGRTFTVRPEDAPRLGIRHLASHAGLTDIGFRITYVTVDGKDYVIAAEETAPPQ
jgi:hypothetical protein